MYMFRNGIEEIFGGSIMITYIENKTTSPKTIADLRRSVGWNGMEESYSNPLMDSYYHIACYDGERLVGYIDSVSNGVTDAYIQDLAVDPAYHGQGIGTELMNRLINKLKEKRFFGFPLCTMNPCKNFINGSASIKCCQEPCRLMIPNKTVIGRN
jgi:ribosomal protein S18 acetylase RimI-like enzyme